MKKRYMFVAAFCVVAVGVSLLKAQTSDQKPAVTVLDPALRQIVSPDAQPQLVKDGFGQTEGPVWVQRGKTGYLLFSDIPGDVVDKLTAEGTLSVYLQYSGYHGPWDGFMMVNVGGGPLSNGFPKDSPLYKQFILLGSDGLTMDRQGRLLICNIAGRSLDRIEKDGERVVLADKYDGKQFNGPNDVIVKRDGTIYFSDMYGGLRHGKSDPLKGLDYSDIFMIKDGKLSPVITDIPETNGLALSPDERYLYVNTDGQDTIKRYIVQPDDTVTNGELFVDLSPGLPADALRRQPAGVLGHTDGLKVDSKGNVYSSGPGGMWIISAEGKPLSIIHFPEQVINFTFGDPDWKTIYVTAETGIYKIRVNIPGIPSGGSDPAHSQ